MPHRNYATIIRRDATYVGNAVVSVVCAGFASIAVVAAVIDLMPN